MTATASHQSSIPFWARCAAELLRAQKGNTQARIFCRELNAELLAIDGYYQTADDIAPDVLRAGHAGVA